MKRKITHVHVYCGLGGTGIACPIGTGAEMDAEAGIKLGAG